MRWTICCFTAAAVLLMIATADVAGQVRAVRVLPSGAIITSEISVDVGNADVAAQIAAAAEATEGDASESSSTDDKLLQMFQQLKFDRRPSAILRQWSKPEPELEPEPKLEPNDDPAADKDDAADDNTEAKDEGAAEKESTEEATTVEQSTKEKAGEEAATDEAATDEAATQEKAEEQAKVEAEKAKRKQEAEQKHEAWVKKKLELFQRHVTLGQWEKVREFFAGLPEKQREPAYKHLLTQLAVGPQPQQNAGNVPQLSPEMFADQDPMAVAMAMQTIMQVQGGGDPLMLEQNVFSTHDVLEIALACPSKKGLQKSESQQLGRILTTSLRTGSVLDGLLNELDEAVADGAKSKILSKRQAAWILFSAGRTLEAGDFLPKMDEAKEAHDREGLNLLSRYYLAKYREESKPADLEQAWFVTQAVLAMEDESVTGSDGNKGDNEANADEVAADEKSETDDTGDGAAVAEVVTDPFAQGVAVEGDAGVQDDEVVKKSDGVSAEKEEALKRAVELAPKVRKELGQAWLRETFTTGEKRGQELLAAIGTATATGMQRYPHNPTERLRGLQLQSTAVEALMQHAPERARQWRDALNVLANNWLKEAAFTYLRDESTQRGPRLQRDMYGNIFYYEDSYNRSMRGNGQAQPVSTDDVLKVRPDDQWLAMLDDMMRPKYSMTVAQLLLKVNEETEAFPYIEQLAAAHKEKADQLANEFLDVWSRNHNPNEANQRTSSYMFMYGYESRAAQIPLTRSKQVRNLQELSQWIARMRAIPIENIDQKKLVKAFTACHSTAEVYRLEDIEQVFGSVDKLEPETLATMIDSMRASLATVWREPDEQKKAGTNRKKQDLQAEIERGYQVAAEVLQRAIMEYPESWQLWCTQASLKFDENDYRYELANDSQFVARRDEAFADFAKAAELYAAQVSDLADDKQDTEIYDKWWYASLGAVDLGRIDTSKQPDLRQPPKIREAMMALPGESAEKHLGMFANRLFNRMSSVKPEQKFRYLRTGFEIVGDHEQALEAKQVYDYYNDLVTEIKLQTVLDGSDNVGHETAFGVFVYLRHTKEIERESGGFGKYLQNQNNMYYSYNYGRPTEDYRDKFSEAATEALKEQFEVLSITFNNPEATSQATQEPGWRITPYAYLLLKARGPEVDKVPPVEINLDFLDTSGYVILPVASPTLPIDAGEKVGNSRPLEKLKVVQTLDERQADEGKLILEIQATANGLVPDWKEIVDLQPTEFEIVNVDDQGLSVSRFDPDAVVPTVQSERTWLITLEGRNDLAELPKTFQFAQPKMDVEELTYQRYVDADLATVEQEISLEKQYGEVNRVWMWALLPPVVVFAAMLAYLIFAPRPPEEEESGQLAIPEQITPFTVLGLLKNIQRFNNMPSAQHEELQQSIMRIERHYFDRPAGEAPDLKAIAEHWVGQTRA